MEPFGWLQVGSKEKKEVMLEKDNRDVQRKALTIQLKEGSLQKKTFIRYPLLLF